MLAAADQIQIELFLAQHRLHACRHVVVVAQGETQLGPRLL
jgi:hypothetical protein